jgi:hypothetical protein
MFPDKKINELKEIIAKNKNLNKIGNLQELLELRNLYLSDN